MRVACTALPSTLVPDLGSLSKLIQVGGNKAAPAEEEETWGTEAETERSEGELPSTTEDSKQAGEGKEKEQLWTLGSGGILVWSKGQGVEEKGSNGKLWSPAAILDGNHSPTFAISIPGCAETSGHVLTGSGDGLLCFWDSTLLNCVGRVRLPLRYGCIRGAVYDKVSGLVAVLTRRQSPNMDFVLLVNPATRRLKTVLCNSSLYSVLDIHGTSPSSGGNTCGCMVSYELGEDAKLLGTLEMLQKFDPAKSEQVHTVSEPAQLRNLVGSLVKGGAKTEAQEGNISHNMILSHDQNVLFYIHGGKRKLLTFERKNKTERDVLYDKAIPLDNDDMGSSHHQHLHCLGAAMWGSSSASDGVVYLLSWFKDTKACLQCIRRGGLHSSSGLLSSSRRGNTNTDYLLMRQVELDGNILRGEGNATQWTVLENFRLARSVQKDQDLCLEIVDLADQLEGRSQECVPLNPELHYFRDPKENGDQKLKGNNNNNNNPAVTEELILRDCLGHTFVHVLGYSSGSLSVLPWPLVEAEGENSVERQCFPGHESAICCIAEWSMVNDKKVACRIMLSGCQGGQVKVWNLEKLNCIATMDVCQSSVSAFVIPERNSNCAWSDCFLVVGEDGSISCVSAKEMRKVRAFLGYPHTYELVSLAWNYKRNCLACLSVKHGSGGSQQEFLCTIVDIISCHLDRQVAGSNALASFSDFLSIDKQYLAICDTRGNKNNAASLNYAALEKSLRMVVVSSDLDLLLEASGKQPDLQIALCMTMLSMHVHHIDEKINVAFENQINRALAAINQNGGVHQCTHMLRSSLHLLPTLVGPDNSYTVWLSNVFDKGANKRPLPAQLLSRMNLVVLSALGWAHAKSLISPEHFSSLNTFYGIRVPEVIKGAQMEAMASYVDYLEHTSEHMRDAANVLLNSMIANMEEDAKLSAVRGIKTVLKGCEYGSRSWAKKVLILGSIALSINEKYDHSFAVNALLNSVGEPGLPFHSSLVSLLTRGIASAAGEWKGIIDKCYLKLLSSVTDAIHAVNGQVSLDLSPRKVDKMKPFSTLLCRDKLMHLLALLMQKNVHQFMNIFNEKLCTRELGSGSSVLPMVFTSILSLINTHPWSLFGATHQVVSACFTCMHPSNPNMRKSYLHIGMTVICEMGQKLPFIDMNASSMWICIPTPPVERNASRYIHVFNAKSGDLVHELQFENQRHLTPLAVKLSPDSNLVACYSLEDSCIRVWVIKQSWTATFRLSLKVNLPGQCIECKTNVAAEEEVAKGKSTSQLQGYMLKWISEKEILLLHDSAQIGRYSVIGL